MAKKPNKPPKSDYDAAMRVLEYLEKDVPYGPLRFAVQRIIFRLKWDEN